MLILCLNPLVNFAMEDSSESDSVTLMVFFIIIGSFLISWANCMGPFKSAICFLTIYKGERGYYMLNAREKDMFLDLMSTSPYIFSGSVFFNEDFPTEILFKAIWRILNRASGICLAFVPFLQVYAKVLSTKPLPCKLSWQSAGLLSGRSWVQIPAGPTLRVFKYLRRKCYLCHDICKRLDFLV